MDFLTTDVSTGAVVQRIPTAAELASRVKVQAQGVAEADATAADAQRRTLRRQLLAAIADIGTPTWAQTEAGLTEARGHIARTVLNQWTQQLMVDAIRLALRMCVFLVARELRRVADNREPD